LPEAIFEPYRRIFVRPRVLRAFPLRAAAILAGACSALAAQAAGSGAGRPGDPGAAVSYAAFAGGFSRSTAAAPEAVPGAPAADPGPLVLLAPMVVTRRRHGWSWGELERRIGLGPPPSEARLIAERTVLPLLANRIELQTGKVRVLVRRLGPTLTIAFW
jgi:hypothetical protein